MSANVKVSVSNNELNQVFGALQKFEEMPWMPYQMVFRAGFAMRKLTEQFEQFNKARADLFDKYGVEVNKSPAVEPSEEGKEPVTEPEKKLNDEGRAKLLELLDAKGDDFNGFKMSEFVAAAEKNDGVLVGLTPEIVRSLAPVLIDDVGV